MAYTMLKGRNHLRDYPGTPLPRRAHHKAAPPLDVGIIPGNRFLLLPLRRVSKFVRHRCHGSSATSTKTCILQTATTTSRSAVFQTGTPSIGKRTRNIDHCENDLNSLRSTGSTPKKFTKKVCMKQRRIHHPTFVRTRLSPVSEKENVEQEENLFENVSILDHVRSWNVDETPVHSQERVTELRNVDDQVLGLGRQINQEGAKNLQKTSNLVSKEKTRPKTICGNVGHRYLSARRVLNQRRDSLRYDNHDGVSNTSLKHDILAMFHYISKLRSISGCFYNTCNDEFVQQNSSLRGRQILPSSALERVHDVPRGVTESGYISPVLVELKLRNRIKKPNSQRSSRISSGIIMLGSGVNYIKCNDSAGRTKHLSKPKSATIVGTSLGRPTELLKQQVVRKRLEEAIKRVLVNRTCKSHGGPLRKTGLIIFDQSTANCNYHLGEPEEEEFKGWIDLTTASERSVQTGQEQFGGEAALGKTQAQSSEQCRVVAQQLQKPRKKLRNALPRIHTSERNKVRCSSRPVRHGIFQNTSIGHQFPPYAHMSTNDAEVVEELGRCKAKRPESNSQVRNLTYLKGYLDLSSRENDLPIGPLHAHEEQIGVAE